VTSISYKKGYKYQLHKDYILDIPKHLTTLIPSASVYNTFVILKVDGTLIIKEGYAWDGPSGPTFDTANFMRGSLVHDCLYELIREGHLPNSARHDADLLLKQICLEDGMSRVRAWWVFTAVTKFANKSSLPSSNHIIYMAP
jgi:hypothetical protein